MPSMGKAAAENLCPNTPHSAAGMRTEPPVSVPSANAHRPAAMATADPPLDPDSRPDDRTQIALK